MRKMVEHGMLDKFDDAHVAGFDMWPREAQSAYRERRAQQRESRVKAAMAIGQNIKNPIELEEIKTGPPVIPF